MASLLSLHSIDLARNSALSSVMTLFFANTQSETYCNAWCCVGYCGNEQVAHLLPHLLPCSLPSASKSCSELMLSFPLHSQCSGLKDHWPWTEWECASWPILSESRYWCSTSLWLRCFNAWSALACWLVSTQSNVVA